jgi:hypothetical protein
MKCRKEIQELTFDEIKKVLLEEDCVNLFNFLKKLIEINSGAFKDAIKIYMMLDSSHKIEELADKISEKRIDILVVVLERIFCIFYNSIYKEEDSISVGILLKMSDFINEFNCFKQKFENQDDFIIERTDMGPCHEPEMKIIKVKKVMFGDFLVIAKSFNTVYNVILDKFEKLFVNE